MSISKRSQATTPLKAKKQLRLIRKQKLTLCKKTIRHHRLHWFSGTNSALLSQSLETKRSTRKQYVSSLKEVDNNREFNYYTYTLDGVLHKSSAPFVKPSHVTLGHGVTAIARRSLPAQIAKYLKRGYRLSTSRYRRHLQAAYQSTKNTFPAPTKLKAISRGGRRHSGIRRQAGVQLFGSQFLLDGVTSDLSNTVLPVSKIDKKTNRTDSALFDEHSASVTIKGQAEQLYSTALATTSLSATESKALPLRQKGGRTYAAAKQKLTVFASRLAACKRASPKRRRQARRAAGIHRLYQKYRPLRRALRLRFFAQKLWTSRLATEKVLKLPNLTAEQNYGVQRLLRSRTEQVIQKKRAASFVRVARFLRKSISNKELTLKRGALDLISFPGVETARLIPATYRLINWRFKTRLSTVKKSVLSSLAAYRSIRKQYSRHPDLRPPTRRQRRTAAKSARLRRNVSKGQQKRLRLGRVRQEVKSSGYPEVSLSVKTGTSVLWKKRPVRARRRCIHRLLGAITSSLTTFTRLKEKQEVGVLYRRSRVAANSRGKRFALWSLFSAAKAYRALVTTDPEKLARVEPLIQQLRRGLRRGEATFAGEITLLFIFLLKILKGSAPVTRKVLYSRFQDWLYVNRQLPNKAIAARVQTSPLSAALHETQSRYSKRVLRSTRKSARRLFHFTSGKKTKTTVNLLSALHSITAKFRYVDAARLQLRNMLQFNEPRPTFQVGTASVAVPATGLKVQNPELIAYDHKQRKVVDNGLVCQLPYLTRSSLITTATPTTAEPELIAQYVPPHAIVTTLLRTNRKKYLLRRRQRRKSRFTRFIPRHVKTRLDHEKAVASNQRAVVGPRVGVLRYLRHVYPKGNRIFIARYKKTHRVAAKYLVKQRRWSRATTLRLSRRRPVWRRTPVSKQTKLASGRVMIHTPRIATNGGWRARKAAAKQRRPLREWAEQFKTILKHVNNLLPKGAPGTQSGAVPRVLNLIAGTSAQAITFCHLTEENVGALAVTAFYMSQRRLHALRPTRATHAVAQFKRTLRRTATGLYRHRGGKFRSPRNRRRRQPRTPRWVRLISKSSNRKLNFIAKQGPKFINVVGAKPVATGANSSPVRKQLWAGIGRYYTVRSRGEKGLAAAKKAVSSLASDAISLSDCELLAKKMRRLSLLKKLLRGNKFSKLARLGELNALGDYTYLADLGKLFELGSFTNQLKQQILLKLATDITLCATLCARSNFLLKQPTAFTTRKSHRVLFVYRKPPVVFGRDKTFFQSDTPKVKVARTRVLRKKVLLRTLIPAKTSPLKRSNIILARTARAARVLAEKQLQRYQRVLPAKKASTARAGRIKLRRKKSTLRFPGSSWAKIGHFESLWKYARSQQRRATHPSYSNSLQSTRRLCKQRKGGKRSLGRARAASKFIALRKLPRGYKGVTRSVDSPTLWVGRHNLWTPRSIRATNEGVLAKHGATAQLKSFSVTRPWGVKSLYSGEVATEYGRFEAGVTKDIAILNGPTDLTKLKPATRDINQLTLFRLAAARMVRAQSGLRVLHTPANISGKKFWQLRRPTRDQIRVQKEQHLRAVALKRTALTKTDVKETGLATEVGLPEIAVVGVKAKKITPLATIKKPSFPSYHVKELNGNVFDLAVRTNLQHFYELPVAERSSGAGYDFIKRAYKAALSSQEKNPELPQLQFDLQKGLLAPILEESAGVPLIDGKVLEWKQLPKNKITSTYTAPVNSVRVAAAHTAIKASVAITGELTSVEVNSILDESTKKHLKKFIGTPLQHRRSAEPYLLVKKAVLHSWTKVEEANIPKESPHYNDLLLSAKAYSFYGVTLDLTSKSATMSKIAPIFAKLPK